MELSAELVELSSFCGADRTYRFKPVLCVCATPFSKGVLSKQGTCRGTGHSVTDRLTKLGHRVGYCTRPVQRTCK